jgi:hypothetical protein
MLLLLLLLLLTVPLLVLERRVPMGVPVRGDTSAPCCSCCWGLLQVLP